MKKILTFNTGPEAHFVSQLLDEEGTNYTIMEHGASNFPGVFEGNLCFPLIALCGGMQKRVVEHI